MAAVSSFCTEVITVICFIPTHTPIHPITSKAQLSVMTPLPFSNFNMVQRSRGAFESGRSLTFPVAPLRHRVPSPSLLF